MLPGIEEMSLRILGCAEGAMVLQMQGAIDLHRHEYRNPDERIDDQIIQPLAPREVTMYGVVIENQ